MQPNTHRSKSSDPIKNRLISINQHPGQPLANVALGEAWNAVNTLLKRGNSLVSAYMLQQIAEQVTEHPGPLTMLLKVYRDNMRMDEAVEVSRTLLHNFPDDIVVLLEIARLHQVNDDAALALQHLERAFELDPVNCSAFHLEAEIAEGMGDFERANRAREKGIAHFPNDPNLIFSIARSGKHSSDYAMISRAQVLAEQGQMSNSLRSILLHALAWFHSNDMDRHFHYLNQANDLAYQEAPWLIETAENDLKRNMQEYSRDLADVLQQYGDEDYKPIFIAAMPRSGTTLLEQMIGAHSETSCLGERGAFDMVTASHLFDNNPFSSGNDDNVLENYGQYIEKVISGFKSCRQVAAARTDRIVDKSIGNWTGAGKIMLAFPNAKIIHLLRHPLDVVLSCYQQAFDVGHTYSNNLIALAQQYIIYRKQMDFWKEVFPDSIHTIYYEELVREPEPNLRAALQFCELEWEDACLNYRDQMSSIATASMRQVRRPLYTDSVHKWRQAEKHLEPAIEILQPYLDYPA